MNLIVTGGSGLLGSALIKKLSSLPQYNVSAIFRNTPIENTTENVSIHRGHLLDQESLIDDFRGKQCVIHTAASISFSKKDKEEMFRTNIEGTANVVNACLAANVKRLIHVSSVAAIGRPFNAFNSPEPINIDEEFKWIESPLNSNYAKSKYEAELEVWRGEAEGLEVSVVNPSIILGEGDIHKSSSRLFEYVMNKNLFYVEGNINFVDLQDVVKAIQILIDDEKSGIRYILNAGTVSYRELFEKIAAEFKIKPPKIKLGNAEIDILWRLEALRAMLTGSNPIVTKETSITARTNTFYKSDKIKQEKNFSFNDIDETLKRVCKYFKDNYQIKEA